MSINICIDLLHQICGLVSHRAPTTRNAYAMIGVVVFSCDGNNEADTAITPW